jgi:hypothetical protein
LKVIDISEVRTASIIRAMPLIALMMEALCTSETLFNFNVTTWHYIQKTLKLQSYKFYSNRHFV